MNVTTHIEPLSGGLVTSRPAHMLAVGEMAALDNCTYRFDSLRLLPAESRLQTLSSINGGSGYSYKTLGFAQFDDGTSYFITQVPAVGAQPDALRLFEATSAASELSISSYTQSSTLVVVPFRDRALVLNGANANKVIYHSGGSTSVAPTAVQHGLDSVTLRPGLVMTTGAWPLGTEGLDQWYEYWYTEVVLLADGTEIESNTEATAVATTPEIINALTDAVRITVPATYANPAARALRLYRSVGKGHQTDTAYPIGIRIAEISIDDAAAGATFTDGAQTSTGELTGTGATTGSPAWSNPTNVTSNDNTFATCVITHNGTQTQSTGELTVSSISGLTSLTNPITSVEFLIDAKYATTVSGLRYHMDLQFDISVDGGTTFTPITGVPITTGDPASPYSILLDQGDPRWAPFGIDAGLLAGGNLRVRLIGHTSTTATTGTTTFSVDYIAIKVRYAGTSGTSGVPFPAVVLDINGETASVGANGKPPTASTGCIFEDTLVCNDIAHPSFVWWGYPGNLHSVPSIYFNDMETPRNDAVKCLMTVGSRVAVGLETCLWRINWLPTEADATFQRGSGAAFDEVDPSYGIVGPNAATTFVGPDGRLMLAYISLDGPRISDLFTTSSACDDIDWRTLLPSSSISRCVLVNYPRNHTLRLYYPGGDSTYLIKYIDLLYHPSHLKGGKMKAVGPVDCGVLSSAGVLGAVAAPSLHTGYSWSVVEAWGGASATSGSKFWRRVDLGTGGATAAAPIITTREMFLAGFGSEWRIKDTYLVGGVGASTPPVWVPTLSLRYTNLVAATAAGLNTVTATYNPTKFSFNHTANAIKLSFTTATTTNDAALGWDLLAIDAESAGKEDD